MPYFKWTGIDLSGKMRHGKRYAQSYKELDASLFKRDIALLSYRLAQPIWFSRMQIASQLQFFTQLATLLRAGILLPQALTILADQAADSQLQYIIHAIAEDVQTGVHINVACAKHPRAFSYLMIRIIEVGNNAGNLPEALDLLAHHLTIAYTFQKKVRSAAMLPALTFVFFCIVALFLFVIIVPQFNDLFTQAKQQLPPLTRSIIAISQVVRSWMMVGVGAALAMVYFVFKYWRSTTRGMVICDATMVRIPYLRTIIVQRELANFLSSLAMLLKSGMQMLPALHIAENTIRNSLLRGEITQLNKDVQAGCSLSHAMENHESRLFHQDLVALVRVGEESGSLSTVLLTAADMARSTVEQALTTITSLLQPFLVILLGVLIAALIFAIYMPIFNLANII